MFSKNMSEARIMKLGHYTIRGRKTKKPIERFFIIGLEIQTQNRLIISDWEFLGLDPESFRV